MRIPIPTSSPPARSHRSLVQKQPHARDAPRTGGGAIASGRASQPSQHLRKWWLLPLSSPSILFSCGLWIGQPFGETAAAACSLRQQITVFLTAATIKSLVTKRDQPKSRSSGRGGELCLVVDIDHHQSRIMERDETQPRDKSLDI